MSDSVWRMSKWFAWVVVLLHPLFHAFEGGAAEQLVTAALTRLECER